MTAARIDSPVTDTQTPLVRDFRQTLVWPLQLLPASHAASSRVPHEQVHDSLCAGGWQPVVSAFSGAEHRLSERHYKEFVSFLPHAQRFLYGESRTENGPSLHGESALSAFRRSDIAQLRIVLREGEPALLLRVEQVELCLLDDVDVALLQIELHGQDLSLASAHDLLYRFGRAYPTGWDEDGNGVHNALLVEWLDSNGAVLASSDADQRDNFLTFAAQHRAPTISSHWAFLLQPLVLEPTLQTEVLRFRQIEYHRMPLLAYLALDNPRHLTQEQWVRLGLVATLHPDEALPLQSPEVREFEARYCYDRYWSDSQAGPNSRFLCSGRSLLLVGDANSAFFLDAERGMLAQFRHQYRLLFMVNHFHRATLLLYSQLLGDAMQRLDVRSPESIRRFKRRIRASFEAFLRFTHRYWFHELSEIPQLQAVYRLCATRLGNDTLYAEIKAEIREMVDYLDSDAQRRQSTTVMRLTVVTTLSLVGTVATGFLGMNIFADADAPLLQRSLLFFAALSGTGLITAYAVVKSKRLADLLDVLSDESLRTGERLRTIFGSWRRKH
ncbi:MAG: hypothetical protein Q7J74_15395 [Pseudomonas sp.]|nr:hypothetical protein [Pseudomonas sp.]